MKIPGRDHPITIKPHGKRVVVRFAGQVIADTANALELKESSYAPVYYVPRQDVEMAALSPSSTSTHCPYKGDARYFSIEADGKTAKDAVWSYEAPYPSVAAIRGHLAFYPNRVDAIEILG